MVVVHSDVLDPSDISPWTERSMRIVLVPLNFIRWTSDHYWFGIVVDSMHMSRRGRTRVGARARPLRLVRTCAVMRAPC